MPAPHPATATASASIGSHRRRMWGPRLARTQRHCKNPARPALLTAFREVHSFARPTQGGFMRFILMTIVALAAAGVTHAADDVAATVGSTSISRADLEKHVKPRLI